MSMKMKYLVIPAVGLGIGIFSQATVYADPVDTVNSEKVCRQCRFGCHNLQEECYGMINFRWETLQVNTNVEDS
ncbi:hypothetical protein AYR57_05690 [Pediococcus claussenii]|nr:hypothetical protein AYR57_05690 [Pediococcus claussenii]ANZ71646.1 hypothetical protein AYR58_05695 [Pediococcus claussenii]